MCWVDTCPRHDTAVPYIHSNSFLGRGGLFPVYVWCGLGLGLGEQLDRDSYLVLEDSLRMFDL